MTRKQQRIYRNVRGLLRHSTPLRTDCGVLCGAACCKGDRRTGMLLFPGEKTALRVTEQNGRRLAVCGGICRRGERPLSCRLFPFLPLPTDGGGVEVVPDSRGYGICPLVRHAEETVFSRRFLHRVRRAGEQLMRDRETRAFLASLRREAEESETLLLRFGQK